jgi:hypothetical protein
LDIGEIITQSEFPQKMIELAKLTALVLKDTDVDIARFIADQEKILQDASRGVVSSETRELIRLVKPKFEKCLLVISKVENLINKRE